jgi:shikimate kinase
MPYVIQYLRQEEKGKIPDQLFPSTRAGSIQQHKEFVNNMQGMAADRETQTMKNGADKQQGLPDRIVLTGFRATGKTAVGKALARLTGFRFLDTDQELCQRMGYSVAEAVRQHGWPYFREQEQALLRELPSWQKTIIATGGGAFLHHNEWQELHRAAFVVWLRTDLATTLSRLALDQKTAEQRPALVGGIDRQEDGQNLAKEIAAMLADREPLYRAGSDLVLDTEEKTPEELAGEIYGQL